jgi:hypothetical protein
MTPYQEKRRVTLKGGEGKVDVRWRLNVSSAEKRVRKDFETHAAAVKYAAAIKTVKKRAGVSAAMTLARLPDRILMDVVTALDLATTLFSGQPVSFAEMVRKAAAVEINAPKFEHIKLEAAICEYLEAIRGHIDPTWHRTLGGCLRKIAKCLGDLEVHEISADLLEDVFEEQAWGTITTWNHHRAYFITFLKWAAKKTTRKAAYITGDNPAEAIPTKTKNRDQLEDISVPPPIC